MKALSLFAVLLTLGLSVGLTDAEAARRLGGGKSFGIQRQMTPPTKAPTAAPAQSPSAVSTATAAPSAAAAQAPKRSWMGPVAGLAAEGGLGRTGLPRGAEDRALVRHARVAADHRRHRRDGQDAVEARARCWAPDPAAAHHRARHARLAPAAAGGGDGEAEGGAHARARSEHLVRSLA